MLLALEQLHTIPARPEDVSLAVANCLTILTNHAGRGAAEPEVQALADDLESLHRRMRKRSSAAEHFLGSEEYPSRDHRYGVQFPER
ncbi:hypothetical protein GCM10018966_026470 [Streptomyces yanii]